MGKSADAVRPDKAMAVPTGDDEPVVMEDEFYDVVADLMASRCAVVILAELMQKQRADGGAVMPPMLGVGVLLEGVGQRLELALDAMMGMGHTLGFAGSAQAAGD